MDINELLTALDNYVDAKAELKQCESEVKYDGAYYLSEYYSKVSKAKKELTDKLNAYIDHRIFLGNDK